MGKGNKLGGCAVHGRKGLVGGRWWNGKIDLPKVVGGKGTVALE